MLHTYFADPERATDQELTTEIEIANDSPVISGLLNSISGMLAILNEHRQILALNVSFLKMLGIEDPFETLGLRPGEAVGCIHANKGPCGCGTSKLCSTCGAAIAIVSSLSEDKPAEKICSLTINKGEQEIDLALLVRSQPINIKEQRFLLLFLQDITLQQQRAALENTFFHDVNNMLSTIVMASELLTTNDIDNAKYINAIQKSASRLRDEVAIQRNLLQGESYTYKPFWVEVKPEQIIEELQTFVSILPQAHNKKVHFQLSCKNKSIKTDLSLLLRTLNNMIKNALEATDPGREVKVWLDDDDNNFSFHVWNHIPIPEGIGYRIFQRNFSTKEGDGRGIGTFSMKLFGEKVLGGKIEFTSSQEKGTEFKFTLPLY